ncbi:MAG: hypothetical protein GY920_06065 [Aliivibrio sp.]|nr:hypothetical protein [Aliivibrio sp.]
MENKNFTLKNPLKIYIWSVKSVGNKRMIMFTLQLSPKDFDFQVGQFIGSPITEMKLIGYKYVKDHFGHDVEETFQNTNKFMKQSILDHHNELYANEI